MINRWISLCNCVFVLLSVVFFLMAAFYWFKIPAEIACEHAGSKDCALPKLAFELSQEEYAKGSDSLLALQETPPSLELPDLRQQLIYYGKNGRPDVKAEESLMHFALSSNNKEIASISTGQKLYLVYNQNPVGYSFSPKNEKTSLWVECKPFEKEAEVHVCMENDKGESIQTPEKYAHFRVQEKEFIRLVAPIWEVGSFKVDGTLLARQRARWYGADLFLEQHGGEDFKDALGKQRIDFGDGEAIYSVFVSQGDCLIWDRDQWRTPSLEQGSVGYPLLVIKKLEDRLITFELWDIQGRGKVTLNLLKSMEPWSFQNPLLLQNAFKFIGARTRKQCVFEINKARVSLSPSDWLLLTPKGWKKIATEQEIDDFVKRKLTGTLFVFDGISRKGDKQVMMGRLYSPSRNDRKEVELFLQASDKKGPSVKKLEMKEIKEKKKAKEEDDD